MDDEVWTVQVVMGIGGILGLVVLFRIGYVAWNNRPTVYWRLPTGPSK